MAQRARLSDFILANVESILTEWEKFASGLPAAAEMDRAGLRDHAEDILRATVRDMASAQTADQQADKSRGRALAADASDRLDRASAVHGVGRATSGFALLAVVAEYRALRASVIRLWGRSTPDPDRRDLDDLTRFNESIDQSLTEAVRSHTEQLDRSRQLFLAILGHDLRNPLNSITMSAELLSHEPVAAAARPVATPVAVGGLAEDAEESANAGDLARRIKRSAAAMDRMIHDLLDFAGAALGGGMPLSPAPVDLAQICREVVEEMHAAHPASPIEFSVARGNGNGTGAADFTGEWDGGRLRQLVSNLVGNAFQHGATDGPVALSLTGGSAEVVLAVLNQGPPIPAEVLTTIFDPLVRVGSTESQGRRRRGSIGLGLYIAREVVTAHGGSVEVRSSREEGTVFTARLPRRRRSRA